MADEATTDTATLSAIPSAMASGVATPASMPPMDPEERAKSIMVSLADLTAKATALYAQKKYEEAAEIYAQASEMQAEFNGEMSPENADILFLYGRSLFKVGQSKSDVLGGRAPAAEKKPNKKANGASAKSSKAKVDDHRDVKEEEQKTEADKIAEEGVAILAKSASGSGLNEGDEKKPLFQFTGDENFEDSDEEGEEAADGDGEGEGEDEEEEDDDLGIAFEILDLARVLFEKKLESSGALAGTEADSKGKGTAEADPVTMKYIKERLADTHDLLAEISLENEKYPVATNDSRASLKYKLELYPQESEIVAEAHFKLSLALEFASITADSEIKEDGPKTVDEELRNEAADELQKAIDSSKLKLQAKEVDLALIHDPEENETTRKVIADVKDMIADLEQRLVDLRKPPVDVNSVLGADNPMTGILGAALGESAAETHARVAEAKKNANDLSGLVRKKEKKPEATAVAAAPAAEQTNGNGKRKADDDAAVDESDSKKAKVKEATA